MSTTTGVKYTEEELWLILRQERLKLTKELEKIHSKQRELARREMEITERLTELSKGEDILEGGL